MTKEDRKIAVLRFLDEVDIGLKPHTIFLNMQDRGSTFAERTVKRRLYELVEEGLVEKRFDGDYYQITERGREYIRD